MKVGDTEVSYGVWSGNLDIAIDYGNNRAKAIEDATKLSIENPEAFIVVDKITKKVISIFQYNGIEEEEQE